MGPGACVGEDRHMKIRTGLSRAVTFANKASAKHQVAADTLATGTKEEQERSRKGFVDVVDRYSKDDWFQSAMETQFIHGYLTAAS